LARPEVYAEWLRLQGTKVLRTPSTFWSAEWPGVFQAFPYHLLIQPSEDELSSLFRRERAMVLRYSAPADGGLGSISHHVVYGRGGYGFEHLGQRTRKNIRRGLRNCRVAPIPMERAAEEGWLLHVDTLSRQGRRRAWTRESWRDRLLSAAKLPGFEAWGATVGDKLAAYALVFQMEDWFYILDQKSLVEYLSLDVNKALMFTVTGELLGRPGISSVLYSVESLDARESLEDFKLHMGFIRKPVRQCIAFHPYISPLVNAFTHSAVRALVKCMPGSRQLTKAEGIMRFYLNRDACGQSAGS
jgi:hypothetical protein